MPRSRRTLVLIWAITTVIVLVALVLLYRNLTEVPLLAGRTEPTSIYSDPTVLFDDPGVIGSAIEVQVTERIRACMEDQGFTYRGPAQVDDLDEMLGADDGYGIALGPEPPGSVLGAGGPSGDRTAYEVALYGADLDAGTAGGCAAEGRQELESALATLESMPYSLDQLQSDAWDHPATAAALDEWRDCMADRGYDAQTPLDLIDDLRSRLATVSGEDAAALAEEERTTAADDRDCRRSTIDEAVDEVAADLAPEFVERNRTQLEAIIPSAGEPGSEPDLGTGDVQVTLRWESEVDMDLSVLDPDGSVIDFEVRTSPSGGELDRDANYPCTSATSSPVENVYWPVGQAPAGQYQATVVYRTSCDDLGTQPFSLVVRVGGQVILEESGALEPGGVQRFDFRYGSF